MIPVDLLNAVGLDRTHDTMGDMIKYHTALQDPDNRSKVDAVLVQMNKPFYRYFANYGTGIGETMEEVVGRRFAEFIPKHIAKTGKDGKVLKGKTKNPVYTTYNKETGKKPSNYDWLAQLDNLTSWEVKVIRAAESKPKGTDKLYEIPSLLEERALTFAEGSRSGNGTFQQTKAELFDYLLGVVVYSDQVDFYVVPSEDIKNGKLKITNQHAGAIMEDGSTNEGHLGLKDVEAYRVKSVYTEEELLEKDSLLNYLG